MLTRQNPAERQMPIGLWFAYAGLMIEFIVKFDFEVADISLNLTSRQVLSGFFSCPFSRANDKCFT
jgi:hypothetical protein